MANKNYSTYIYHLETGGSLDLESASLKVVLLDTDDYSPNLGFGGDEFLGDIPDAAQVATTSALTNVSVDPSTGVVDADDVTLPDTGGDTAEAAAIFHATGNDGTARLIYYFDNASGLPITPDSVDDTIQWPASGIFRIQAP